MMNQPGLYRPLATLLGLLVFIAPLTSGAQALTLSRRAEIINVVLAGRTEILRDDTPISGCSIYRLLDATSDYLELIEPRLRRFVEVESPVPCAPHAIDLDTTILAGQKRQRMLQLRPNIGSMVSIKPLDAGRFEVELIISRPGVTFSEWHDIRTRSTSSPANSLRTAEIRVGNFLIH